MMMVYEVTKDYPLKEKEIETPICKTISYELDKDIILCKLILRAGGSCGWLQKNHTNCESRSYCNV